MKPRGGASQAKGALPAKFEAGADTVHEHGGAVVQGARTDHVVDLVTGTLDVGPEHGIVTNRGAEVARDVVTELDLELRDDGEAAGLEIADIVRVGKQVARRCCCGRGGGGTRSSPNNVPFIDKRASGCRQVAAEQELTTTRGLKIMTTGCLQQLTLWDLGPQQVTVTFQGGRIVSDAGLLGVRKLDKELGVLSLLAERLPDPRVQSLVVHSRETLFTQQVYQILAGYPDCNDAQTLRNDPLFHTLLDLSAEEDAKPLASGSTLARFAQAFTRREADLPLEERPVLLEVAAAQNQRLKILNDYLPELFIRTRRARPACVILDIDASDDPTHGQQVLSFYHGYYEQHQYFPLYVFDEIGRAHV